MTILKEEVSLAVNKQVPYHQSPTAFMGIVSQPWSRLYLDFAGTHVLVVVDSHSKWLDLHTMQSIIAERIYNLFLLPRGIAVVYMLVRQGVSS